MNIVDRQAIEDLFARLKDTESQAGPRDEEAEALIAKLVERQPAVAYYLAQTVLVQQWALNNAHARLEAQERRAEGGGLLSFLFGRGRKEQRRVKEASISPALAQNSATGFLATAANTTLGVAGGFVLIDVLEQGNFTSGSLAAGYEAETPAGAGLGGDMSGGGDAGGVGDFGGMGDFGGGGGE